MFRGHRRLLVCNHYKRVAEQLDTHCLQLAKRPLQPANIVMLSQILQTLKFDPPPIANSSRKTMPRSRTLACRKPDCSSYSSTGIRSLPPELLTHIFELAAEIENDDADMPVKLECVCLSVTFI